MQCARARRAIRSAVFLNFASTAFSGFDTSDWLVGIRLLHLHILNLAFGKTLARLTDRLDNILNRFAEGLKRKAAFVVVHLHAGNKAWSIGQMGPKFGKKSSMRGVASLSRNAAAALVEREERKTGSRMAAYEVVAQTVGTSGEWLRRFIRGGEAKEPKLTVGLNLIHFYSRVCDRVERAGDEEKQLKDDINAALESFDLLVERATRAKGSSEAAE